MKIKNNPIDILLCVFEEYFPETAKLINSIEFAYIDSGFALTDFDDDGIRIYISPTMKEGAPITFEVATELLAHELAHAIVGIDEGHSAEWDAQFSKLQKLYTSASKNLSVEEDEE